MLKHVSAPMASCENVHLPATSNTLRDPGFGPPAEALMHVLPITKALRQITPGDAGSIPIERSLDEQAVVRFGRPYRTGAAGQKFLIRSTGRWPPQESQQVPP